MVAGSDRTAEYHKTLHKYNGVKGTHGYFKFKDIKVHSAGERDPDAEGVEGMSASKMREHASKGNFKEFKKGVPGHVAHEHAKDLFNDVRKGMNIKEDLDTLGKDLTASTNKILEEIQQNITSVVSTSQIEFSDKTDKLNGVIMISLAAFTEAMIYFIVRRLKTTNNWNHIFLSYFPGSLLMTGFLFNQINFKNQNINLSLILNGVIGLVGYLLRFFAISKLSPSVYAPLSYFGVIMAYVYGILINGEQITLMKVLGSLCIVIPNLLLL
jgi:uncharacterized membrane protein